MQSDDLIMRFLWLLVYLLLSLLALVTTYEGLDRVLSADTSMNPLLAGATTLWLSVVPAPLPAALRSACLQTAAACVFSPQATRWLAD